MRSSISSEQHLGHAWQMTVRPLCHADCSTTSTLQDNNKRWQLIILAHSMGNRPTTAALGKVYTSNAAALQLNTPDAPMLVSCCI